MADFFEDDDETFTVTPPEVNLAQELADILGDDVDDYEALLDNIGTTEEPEDKKLVMSQAKSVLRHHGDEMSSELKDEISSLIHIEASWVDEDKLL